MKKIAEHNYYKRIACFLVIILLCNFLLPNFADANTNYKENNEDALTKFFCAIGDIMMELLQSNITGVSGIKYNGNYELHYSPGVIFSGRLSAFDINFIRPIQNEERYIVLEPESLVQARSTILVSTTESEVGFKTTDTWLSDVEMQEILKDTSALSTSYTPNEDLLRKSDILNYAHKLQDENGYYDESTKKKDENSNLDFGKEETIYSYWYKDIGNNKLEKYEIYISYENTGTSTLETEGKELRIYRIKIVKAVYQKEKAIPSVAKRMRKTVATWYNVSREIALVGLLCILLYIAIRAIIGSSAKEKARFKTLFLDWLTAMIIVTFLHYIISITLTTTKAITDIFGMQIIGEDGVDIIFTKLRNNVGTGNFMINLINTVMYYALVIMTIKYTIEYFKRVIYIAFLIMISPLIGLTYPLDKIKDGQAQAFITWMREFVFTALLQPLHLILYYVFIGSAVMSDFSESNPVFALVVIAFLPQAEKILKKMFGFDKAGSLGNLESAFGGAAVMNMINQLKGKPPAIKSSATSRSGGGKNSFQNNSGNSENIRTIDSNVMGNPYVALMSDENNQEKLNNIFNQQETGNTTFKGKRKDTIKSNGKYKNKPETKIPYAEQTNSRITGTHNIETNGFNQTDNMNNLEHNKAGKDKKAEKGKTSRKLQERGGVKTLIQNTRRKYSNLQNKPAIKGVKAVEKVILKDTSKGIFKGTIRIAGAVTFGTIGLAAGISTGKFENAFSGAIGGIAAGSKIGRKIANSATAIPSRVLSVKREIEQTLEKGKYGEKEAERREKIRRIKLSREYKDLLREHQDKKNEIDKFLNAGITNISRIRIALDNSNSYSTDNAIAYMKMAELCPTDIFEDREKFNVYLETHGISKSKADEIYKAVRKFR